MNPSFTPRPGRFEEVLEAARKPADESERFTLRGWSGGYAIYDRSALIVTIHGPQLGLAGRLLRFLREDA